MIKLPSKETIYNVIILILIFGGVIWFLLHGGQWPI